MKSQNLFILEVVFFLQFFVLEVKESEQRYYLSLYYFFESIERSSVVLGSYIEDYGQYKKSGQRIKIVNFCYFKIKGLKVKYKIILWKNRR